MRRFTEVVLFLVACTLFQVPPLFVNGLQALRPTVQYNAQQRDTVIRGLLVSRQYYCSAGYYECESTGCCPGNWPCCRDGNCCDPGSYCIIGTNGVIGCCPNGELCYGPVGDPSTISNPTPTTNYVTSTTKNHFTSTSTTTFTTLVASPTQSAGTQIIEVSVLDVNIAWSGGWVEQTSSCSPSITSKSTSTGGSSFTYLFQYKATYGYSYYLNLVNYNTMWEVFINGVSQSLEYSTSTDNCTYFESYYPSLSSSSSASQNLTMVVHGSDNVDSTQSWSLALNKLLIAEQLPSSTSTTQTAGQNSATSIGSGSSSSAAKRAQPYRPLLVIGGVFLAVIY